MGSGSKLFWGGLRVGWIRATAPLIDRLSRRKVGLDLGSSIVSQMVAAKLVPTFAPARADRAELVRRRYGRLTALLEEWLPDWTWDAPRGGLSLWVRIPEGDADEFANVAQRHQVAVLSGPMMSPAEGHRDRLRIPYVHEAAEMEEGVRRLARAWAAYRRVARPRAATASVLV
ncbi:MAG: aminotransferase class I/II-fold pyridoxal phosphate-dependent enzyme [Chloroflexota bacterium]|nr:aminotransferase class I/II-fold pyridoxal phosphate-dependent enzyme [Chloroflexota bacterium]